MSMNHENMRTQIVYGSDMKAHENFRAFVEHEKQFKRRQTICCWWKTKISKIKAVLNTKLW